MAKAYAYAVKAIENAQDIMKVEEKMKLDLDFPLTKIIKFHNLIDQEQVKFYQKQNYDEVLEDITKDVSKLCQI